VLQGPDFGPEHVVVVDDQNLQEFQSATHIMPTLRQLALFGRSGSLCRKSSRLISPVRLKD
jgi:hypothetical protein